VDQSKKNGTEILYRHAKVGGDQFTHGVTRPKKSLFVFFVCDAVRGLCWSRRPVEMFGTSTKYSFVIYR